MKNLLEILENVLEALEAGHEAAAELAADFHEEYAGHYPCQHEDYDNQVNRLDKARKELEQVVKKMKSEPKCEWVGLTDEEMFAAIRPMYRSDGIAQNALDLSKDEYRAIEAALKEKNS
jgi:hypothetical protein